MECIFLDEFIKVYQLLFLLKIWLFIISLAAFNFNSSKSGCALITFAPSLTRLVSASHIRLLFKIYLLWWRLCHGRNTKCLLPMHDFWIVNLMAHLWRKGGPITSISKSMQPTLHQSTVSSNLHLPKFLGWGSRLCWVPINLPFLFIESWSQLIEI